MNLQVEPYLQSVKRLPKKGQHIIGQYDTESIVVYQAYNAQIADYAVTHQYFGGTAYSYNRMSWIKPNFLWMMYRCGWASKENQERVLAIRVSKLSFENILRQAVFSTFSPEWYHSREQWKGELESKEVRLQWDPDHNPYGEKLTRRAIQLGVKGKFLEEFGKQNIITIQDITDFVVEQKRHVDNRKLDKLFVPVENIYTPADELLAQKIGIE